MVAVSDLNSCPPVSILGSLMWTMCQPSWGTPACWRPSTSGKKDSLSGSSTPTSWRGQDDQHSGTLSAVFALLLDHRVHIVHVAEMRVKTWYLFDRYGVLLTVRTVEDSDREQTLALLDMVEAEEGNYQLGLTKVILLLDVRFRGRTGC